MVEVKKDMTERPQCFGQAYERGMSFGSHRCTRSGSVEYEGKWYCRQHDPVAAAEKDRERRARWEEESKKDREKFDRQYAYEFALAGISTETIRREVRGLVEHLVGK
jgi:hypothetical protein